MAKYDFGPFHYDPEQRVLFRDGNVVSLAPKTTDTLHVLLDRRGRVIEKNELMKLVWPDAMVEEVGLARNISILRKAIEDSGEEYIETVPRRGYRFQAEPAGSAPEAEAAKTSRVSRWTWVAATGMVLAVLVYWQFYVPSKYLVHKAGTASLAVVPFESLTSGPDDSSFARGITDLLVANLSTAGSIEVLSPSTVRRHQRFGVSMGLMGRLLGLDVLVEGSIGTSGGRRMVSARLVDVHTGKIIWAKNYDRPAGDGESAQSEVAQDLAAQIGALLAHAKK